jgi:hypothetical protein
MSVPRVCATAAHTNPPITTTNTPAIHALTRVIVVVLSFLDPENDLQVEGSESVLVFGMADRGAGREEADTCF